MPDALGDEIDGLVAKAQEEDDTEDEDLDTDDDSSSDDSDDDESEDKPSKGKRVRKTRSSKSKSSPSRSKKSRTVEEMDLDDMLPDNLPKPGQNIKSLGDMYAKYGVGERPEFKVHLYRSYPKVAPGGTKFDGFYDEYDIPITEQQIQSDYGGGQYRVVVVGPNPKNPRIGKHYESFNIGLAGDPNWERMPRALQGSKKDSAATNNNPPPLSVAMPQENPKLAEVALKMIGERSKEDREELRRREERMERQMREAGSGTNALADAERRRADDLIKAERERAEERRALMEKRMQEIEREQKQKELRYEQEMRSRPSIGEELRHLAPLLQRGDDSGAKEMLTQILQKHRDELASIQSAHQEFLRDVRAGHRDEMAALRQAHQREIEAEREASRGREERIEERLRSERAERERDRTRHKEAMDERDRHWKDRMDGQLQMQNTSWEARHQAQVSTYENRIQWLQQEIDKLKSENYELKQKHEDKGDVFSQLTKHRELQRMMKDFAGTSDSSSSSSSGGGIGLSGGGDDWKSTLAEGITERAPAILEKLFSPGGAAAQVQQPQPQQMQQFTEGQVVDTPQGKMEVVRNPQDGQLALAPKEKLDEYRQKLQRMQQQGGGGGLLSQGEPQRVQSKPPKQPRKPSISAVPDLSQGLPKRRAPWEGGGDEPPPPPQPPPPVPRSASRRPEPVVDNEPMELSSVERQGLQILAKEVHDSVNQADEPEEFVAKMIERYPAAALQQIVGGYTDRQIIQGIVQLQPNSAGATPAGRSFVTKAFGLLRKAVSQ